MDTPPGTSDEHLSLVEALLADDSPLIAVSSLLVTTPQGVAVDDVRREVDFCRRVGLPLMGILENMSA